MEPIFILNFCRNGVPFHYGIERSVKKNDPQDLFV
jgi:hypothetical protein